MAVTSLRVGAPLLRELDRHYTTIKHLAKCFTGHRDGRLVEHSLAELFRQRFFGHRASRCQMKTPKARSGATKLIAVFIWRRRARSTVLN